MHLNLRRVTASALLGLAACLAGAAPAPAAQNDTTLISRNTAGDKANGSFVDNPVISADGRYIAFTSNASNLDAPTTGVQVYLRDTQTDTTTLVSRADGVSGAPSNNASERPSISNDGRYIAFESNASNLGAANPGGFARIYVRDTVAGTTTLVSRADGVTGDLPDENGFLAAISGDGSTVAYVSAATNLDAAATDGTDQIYVRDVAGADTSLVSRVGHSGAAGNGDSGAPALSENGHVVAFDSVATNLDPDDTTSVSSVYVHDFDIPSTTLVSRAGGAAGAVANSSSFAPSITADGQRIAYLSNATNLDAADSDATRDVFVRNRLNNDSYLVSADANGDPGNGNDTTAQISANGRVVVFASPSTNFPDDNTADIDIHMRDTYRGETSLVSRADGAAGLIANNSSHRPTVSANGTRVAFYSAATNLDQSDGLGDDDVYMRETGIDVTPPAVSIDSGPSGRTADNTPTYTFSSVDPDVAFFECIVDGAGTGCSGVGTDTTAPLSEGAHTYAVRATDTSGNTSDPVSVSITVDVTGPTAQLDATPARTNDPTPSFSFTSAAADLDDFQCAIDGAPFSPGCTSPFTATPLTDGAHPFSVRAVDDLGNSGPTIQRQITIDTTGPTAAIEPAPPPRTTDRTPTISFGSDDEDGDLASFQCAVDAASFSACTSPATTAQLADGAHTFKVRALDDLANAGSLATATFTVDNAGPATSITSAPPATTSDNTPTIAFSSGAADLASFQCALDAASFAACTSPVTTAALADGAHTFKVRALDDLGNMGPTQQAAFTIDTSPPPDTELSGPDASLARKLTVSGKELNAEIGAGAAEDVDVDVTSSVLVKPKKGKSTTTGLAPVSGHSTAGEQVSLTLTYKGSKKKRQKQTKKLVKALEDGAKATLSAEITLTDDAGNSATLGRSAKLKLKK